MASVVSLMRETQGSSGRGHQGHLTSQGGPRRLPGGSDV